MHGRAGSSAKAKATVPNAVKGAKALKFEIAEPVVSVQIDTQMNDVEVMPANDRVEDDMTSLRFLHEPAILQNLKERSCVKKPYTCVSNVLIAVNPLQPLRPPSLRDYQERPFTSNSPHPYGIAELAYQVPHPPLLLLLATAKPVLPVHDALSLLFPSPALASFDCAVTPAEFPLSHPCSK
jgi:hypothetical protein